jgi:hypothetical protein
MNQHTPLPPSNVREVSIAKTQYLVFAGKHEAYLAEREENELDAATTLKDIASGQWEHIQKVIVLHPDGMWIDATKDVASAVMNVWAQDGEPLTRWQRDFIEMHVGIQAANSFRREAV